LGDSEAATDGGAEKFIGVGWALMTDDVLGELLQLEEGKGKVRDHPAGEERRVEGELTVEGHRRPEMRRGAAVVQPLAWMRGRGEREGAHGVLWRKKGGGEGRGSDQQRPFKRRSGGHRGRGAGGGRRPRGGDELGMGVGDRRSGRAIKFDLKSNSNYFKIDSNHSNYFKIDSNHSSFDHLKNGLPELKKFELKYCFEDPKEMNNFLHRGFFRFGMDFKWKIRQISRLEFTIVSSWNFELGWNLK
jgi:hypothetical protein